MARRTPPTIWAVGQHQPHRQRDDLYTPEGNRHPAKMWPAIAREAIGRYSRPGQIVLDPMCGIGTTAVEAIRLGRNAIGVDCEAEWVHLARSNIARAVHAHPGNRGEAYCGDATALADVLEANSARRTVDLIVTSPPYGANVHGQVDTARVTGGKIRNRDHRYANGTAHPGQLASASLPRLTSGLERLFAGCFDALKPDGVMALTARPYTDKGRLVDFPALVIAAAEASGFTFTERAVALLARWDGHLMRPHATFFHLRNVRTAHTAGKWALVRAHEDVLIFRRRS